MGAPYPGNLFDPLQQDLSMTDYLTPQTPQTPENLQATTGMVNRITEPGLLLPAEPGGMATPQSPLPPSGSPEPSGWSKAFGIMGDVAMLPLRAPGILQDVLRGATGHTTKADYARGMVPQYQDMIDNGLASYESFIPDVRALLSRQTDTSGTKPGQAVGLQGDASKRGMQSPTASLPPSFSQDWAGWLMSKIDGSADARYNAIITQGQVLKQVTALQKAAEERKRLALENLKTGFEVQHQPEGWNIYANKARDEAAQRQFSMSQLPTNMELYQRKQRAEIERTQAGTQRLNRPETLRPPISANEYLTQRRKEFELPPGAVSARDALKADAAIRAKTMGLFAKPPMTGGYLGTRFGNAPDWSKIEEALNQAGAVPGIHYEKQADGSLSPLALTPQLRQQIIDQAGAVRAKSPPSTETLLGEWSSKYGTSAPMSPPVPTAPKWDATLPPTIVTATQAEAYLRKQGVPEDAIKTIVDNLIRK